MYFRLLKHLPSIAVRALCVIDKCFIFQDEAKPSEPDKELTDVAAEAMSLQPTGHTLATTQVTMIPYVCCN